MIKSLQLDNFKAFEKFRITFKGDAYLVGPNNAGKSTIIAALRSIANMVRIATREKPAQSFQVDGFQQTGYWFTSNQVGLVDENLQHEFHQVETRLKATFDSGAVLEAVWPVEDDGGFFFLLSQEGVNLMRLGQIREVLPSMGTVPVLTPLDHSEELLSEPHVRANLDGRLASRHFRNQLHLLAEQPGAVRRTELEEFKEFAEPWISEMDLTSLKLQRSGGETSFDLGYYEAGSRIEKEIFWAGDGMQIWIQLLLHLFRAQDKEVVVLDEPDVFLHADLQRRLVNLLESIDAQTITATHSAEVIGEAPGEAVVWVSRNRSRAIRAPRRDVLFELSATIGTQFNLSLARALRTRVVVFVEGKDAKILRTLARTLGNEAIVKEDGIAVVPLGGFSHWKQVEPFKWLMDEFFEDAVSVQVLLDRDFQGKEEVDEIRSALKGIGVNPHIWKRKELENYLLVPSCIARASGASEDWVRGALDDCAQELESDVYAEIISLETRRLQSDGISPKTASKRGKERADAAWADKAGRLHLCGGKDLLRLLNQRLQAAKMQAVTDRGLAGRMKKSEIPQEVRGLMSRVEGLAV